ncbi:MAG: ADP-ribosylglycohydrolase family protein [Candidatus Eremiobacteraeota bacterium]|nr:ADP-ribosylglycohydrolase family protein [Candidatus Eremiobacteraeota bacterium]
MNERLCDRFTGSLLGGMIGDIIGAVVEGESPRYIRKTFSSIDDMLAIEHVEEILGRKWLVGQFTDDTIMSLDVAEWLLEDPQLDGKSLLTRFNQSFRPARRYGSGTALILESFERNPPDWRALATLMFPEGSYGNGSAMRAGPIGCYFHRDPAGLIKAARTSSITTHSHPLAVQGAIVQAAAVAAAIRMPAPLQTGEFLQSLGEVLEKLPNDTTIYREALQILSRGLAERREPSEMAQILGNGIEAREAVPMAIYCFLSNWQSFERVIHEAVFIGGDTDTIASMAGSICGAFGGLAHIPRHWLARVREDHYTPARVKGIAEALCARMAI